MTNVEDATAVASVGADQAAIEHHYDVGNDFYALWLDESMTYSCALFTEDSDTLALAQERKTDYYLARLGLRPGSRLLDVGCGWGATLARAATSEPTLELVGLTLSGAQQQHAAARLGSSADIVLEAWQDHAPDAHYNGIVSLGAFEHFVRAGLDRQGRTDAYAEFFEACAGWLGVGGRRLCIQTIALEDQEEQVGSGLSEFFTSSVFPASSLPRVGEIVDSAESWFRLIELRADPDDYARTCREWRARLLASREKAESLAGAPVVRHFRKMLFAAEVQFASRATTLYRLTFERRDEPVSPERGRSSDSPSG